MAIDDVSSTDEGRRRPLVWAGEWMRGPYQDVGIDRPRDLLSNAVRSDRGYAWAHYTSLAVALIVLLFASRGLWFFYDEWDFISSRGLHHPALGLFAPHNEHWSTLPILSYRVLLTRLHTYLPYLLVLFLVHSCWCTCCGGQCATSRFTR